MAEEERPTRTRGIRLGKGPRRRREAFVSHRVAEGTPREEVQVVHADGSSRPLGTSSSWGEAQEDFEVVEIEDAEIARAAGGLADSEEFGKRRWTSCLIIIKAGTTDF